MDNCDSKGETGDTRSRLIEAAAHLFARRGVQAVKLREIHLRAGQRNASAIHYHFGDKQGLVTAILMENDLLASQRLEGMTKFATLRDPEVIVRFLVERLAIGLSDTKGRDWLRIVSELMGHYPQRHRVDDTPTRVATLLHAGLDSMPYDLVKKRTIAMLQLMASQVAERARVIDDEQGGERNAEDDEAFLEELGNMCLGVMTAISNGVPRFLSR